MVRALLVIVAAALLVAPAAHAGCRRAATEVLCELGSTTVTIGTQAVVGYQHAHEPGLVHGSFLPRSAPAPRDGFRIEIQHFDRDAAFCHRFGDETYCY
ncbi:MAG TPA: hypothetical protein VFD84_08000 [Candidatus Binatia bacterium]|jgi:hypothetical protein|nr:hypothetical protein [Candidatus Binatia bacterium]